MTIEEFKKEQKKAIDERVEMKIIEKATGDFLKRLIDRASNNIEVNYIAQLGEYYKKTGFHYSHELEKIKGDTISFFRKNDKLSFTQNKNFPENLLIIGDNYKALLNLLISYRGLIKVIYIDPPYGKDSMGQFADTNYDNAISRDNLLSSLDIRLRIARELLADDGVIFCSIDDRNQAHIKLLFDEIFGSVNFVSCCPRKTRGSATTKSDAELQDLHDYLLIYCRDKEDYSFRLKKIGVHNYPFEDERGKYRIVDLQDNGPHGTRTARPNLYYPIYQNSDGSLSLQKEIGSKEFLPHKHKNDDGCWMWSKKKFETDNKDLCIYNDKVQIKHYLDESEDQNKYQHFKSWLDDFQNTKGTLEIGEIIEKGLFDNPKPVDLIKWCINLVKDESPIILDFYAGSGTTGQAVLEIALERKSSGGGFLQGLFLFNCQSSLKREVYRMNSVA